MKVYVGTPPGHVNVETRGLVAGLFGPEPGEVVSVAPLTHHLRHSPDGFRWGYEGSGCAELARCVLIDALGFDPGPTVYHDFKDQVIAWLDMDAPFRLGQLQVMTWVLGHHDKAAITARLADLAGGSEF